jgi:hypothetical protein
MVPQPPTESCEPDCDSVAAPAIVHLGFARADHPHSATASAALGHREFPTSPDHAVALAHATASTCFVTWKPATSVSRARRRSQLQPVHG